MTKGKIIYIGGFELPDKNAAAHRVISNGKILRDLGYEVIYIGIDKSINKFNINEISESFDFKTYKIPYPKSVNQWTKFILQAEEFKEIANKSEDIKAVICYNLPSISMFKILNYCKKKKIKIFSDSTEWFKSNYKSNIFLEIIKSVDNYLRMYIMHKRIDGVISISNYIHDFHIKRGVSSLNLPPLVDTLESKWKKNEITINNEINFIYAGAAFSSKYKEYIKDRIDIIIKILSTLNSENYNFFFKIVGCTKNEFIINFPLLQSEINQLSSKVKFFGKLTHLETIELIKKSDFSVFVRDETIITTAGFPTKFVESISCGIPVITNKNSNILDYLTDGENGFCIDNQSFENSVDVFREILSLSHEKIELMKQKTLISELFDYRNFSGNFEKFINQ